MSVLARFLDARLQCEAQGDTRGEWDPARRLQVTGNLLTNALPQRFKPFRRGIHDGDTRTEGVGLGLQVRAHGGSVRVESTAQGGTTFTLELPRVPPAAR